MTDAVGPPSQEHGGERSVEPAPETEQWREDYRENYQAALSAIEEFDSGKTQLDDLRPHFEKLAETQMTHYSEHWVSGQLERVGHLPEIDRLAQQLGTELGLQDREPLDLLVEERRGEVEYFALAALEKAKEVQTREWHNREYQLWRVEEPALPEPSPETGDGGLWETSRTVTLPKGFRMRVKIRSKDHPTLEAAFQLLEERRRSARQELVGFITNLER